MSVFRNSNTMRPDGMTGMRSNLLLVEDDPSIRSWLTENLADEGYQVDSCCSLHEARVALGSKYDLLLLDLGLPDGDGLDLCREIRAAHSTLPIIILTAREALEERVRGLDHGADDYVIKPFELPELVARIRSVLRRTKGPTASGRLTVGELWADPETRVAGKDDRTLELRRREFDLLLFLLRAPGRVWTRDQLLRGVWGPAYVGDTRTVDMCVQRLRSKIEEDPRDPRFVETVWGVGYRMREYPR